MVCFIDHVLIRMAPEVNSIHYEHIFGASSQETLELLSASGLGEGAEDKKSEAARPVSTRLISNLNNVSIYTPRRFQKEDAQRVKSVVRACGGTKQKTAKIVTKNLLFFTTAEGQPDRVYSACVNSLFRCRQTPVEIRVSVW